MSYQIPPQNCTRIKKDAYSSVKIIVRPFHVFPPALLADSTHPENYLTATVLLYQAGTPFPYLGMIEATYLHP